MAALTLDSQRQYEAMGVNTTCGGIEIARKPERLEEFRRRMTSATAWGVEAELLTPGRGREARAVHQHRHRARRLLHAERLGGRLAARRARSSASGRWRSARCRRSPASRCSASRSSDGRVAGGRHRPGPHRGGVRRGRVRRVEPAHRGDGRRDDPAHARGAPDDRRRPDPRARSDRQRDRLPDRPRHGHVLLRAPDRRLDGGRARTPTGRSSTTPTTSRRSRRRASRPPSCRSPPTTSTSSSKRRSS